MIVNDTSIRLTGISFLSPHFGDALLSRLAFRSFQSIRVLSSDLSDNTFLTPNVVKRKISNRTSMAATQRAA